MFQLTLLDHLRLTFGHVAHRYSAHLKIAHLRARWSRWLQAAEALLMAGLLFTSLNLAAGRGQVYAIACAVLATVALVLVLIRLAFDLEASARANAWCAARLWHIRERYQAVLSDLADGAIDVEEARVRRDVLMNDLIAIYEAPSSNDIAYLGSHPATSATEDSVLADDQIDMFLPKSLHKPAVSAATGTRTD
jgi:hypothetical protein